MINELTFWDSAPDQKEGSASHRLVFLTQVKAGLNFHMSIEAMTKKVNANMWKSCKKIVLEEMYKRMVCCWVSWTSHWLFFALFKHGKW